MRYSKLLRLPTQLIYSTTSSTQPQGVELKGWYRFPHHVEISATALWQGGSSILHMAIHTTAKSAHVRSRHWKGSWAESTSTPSRPFTLGILPFRFVTLWNFIPWDLLWRKSNLSPFKHSKWSDSLARSNVYRRNSSTVLATVSFTEWGQYPECLYHCECWLWYKLRLGVRMLDGNKFGRWRCKFFGGNCW